MNAQTMDRVLELESMDLGFIERQLVKEALVIGVFAGFDGYQIVLTAENGIRATDIIYLEPSVFVSLNRWHAAHIKPLYQQSNEG
jgi:hypothetical protein